MPGERIIQHRAHHVNEAPRLRRALLRLPDILLSNLDVCVPAILWRYSGSKNLVRMRGPLEKSPNPASSLVRIDRLDAPQKEDLRKLYSQGWWTQGREAADIETMLRYSDILVGLCRRDSRKLVAFARALTDRVYKAFLFDVIVEEAYRGTGLGRVLLDAAVNHPVLLNVRHIELYCRPALVPFYARWGFEVKRGDLCFMRLAR